MGLLEWLFGAHARPAAPARPPPPVAVPVPAKAPAPAASAMAPGTGIHFHPDLIDGLRQEHQHLLGVFGRIQAAAQGGDLAGAAQGLEEFRVLLQGHLLTENVRLYIYLEHSLAHDEPSHELMHSFRHEMDGIGKVVMAFLAEYGHLTHFPELLPRFSTDLAGIGQVLVQRIEREEALLFPLYVG